VALTSAEPELRSAARTVLDRVPRFLPAAADAAVVSASVDARPMPADGLSVVGWVPGVRSLYVVVTHSGVTLAPILGEIATAEVLGDRAELPAMFRPDRFASG
jgi:glycine/D-amino acid oxidase-like deaminating enzyme